MTRQPASASPPCGSETPGDVHIYREGQMDSPELLRVGSGTALVFSTRAPDKTDVNEDAAVLISGDSSSCVLVVADGAGGLSSGNQASSLAIESLCKAVTGSADAGNGLREPILDGIEQANRRINALGVGAATTLAIAEIQGRSMRPYHVGDSMILVVGQRGKLKLQTISHSPVGYAVESGLLDAEEAMHHDERHLVSNMVGSQDMRIEIGATVELAPRDTVLVATDGLFDNLHLEEIVDTIRAGRLDRIGPRLATLCRERMMNPQADRPSKPDDLTFVLFRLEK
jgi:serine/threonine protein phosphatase PrpC